MTPTKKLANWWRRRRLTKAVQVVTDAGLSVVRIVNRAGTEYRIGRKGGKL